MDAKEIIIDNDYSSWNGERTIYFQCSNIDFYFPPDYGTYGKGEPHRCGGDSMFLITHKTIYGTEITKRFCQRCADAFIADAKVKGYKITDIRGK